MRTRGIMKSRLPVQGLTLVCLVGHAILVSATHSHSILRPGFIESGAASGSHSDSQTAPHDEGCPCCQLQRSLTNLYVHPGPTLPDLLPERATCCFVPANEDTNGSSVTFHERAPPRLRA